MINPVGCLLWGILEKKLEDIAVSSGYWEDYVESDAYKRFDAAWVEYLGGLGVERCESGCHLTATANEHFVQDPLYTSGTRLKVPKEVADKILTIGLP